MTFVSVCIPTIYTSEGANDLKNLLRSLSIQTFENFEILIIEGKNLKAVKRIVEKEAKNLQIRILKQKLNGLANARNECWLSSFGEICVFIDDDVITTPQWLEEIVNTYKANNFIGGVGGFSLMPRDYLSSRDITHYLLKPDSILKKIVRATYFKLFLENKQFEINRFFKNGAYSIGSMMEEHARKMTDPIEVDFLDACSMSFKRKVLEEVGGFDGSYVGLGDYHEPDLCFRVRKAGYKLVFNPKAIVYHFPKKVASGAESIRAYERQKNFARFVKKNFGFSFDFLLYAVFLSGYHLFKSISEEDLKFIKGISGLIRGWFDK
jgi:GT2 family glycosyltransferase